ncbi:MAG: hypothetical protein IPG43_06665 [Proteobacteria bacterium]|nr:hypothetical protein [Pseudomonadota bacterium]
MTLEAGTPWPLGASLTDAGVNFAVFSAHATRIELCLYDRDGVRELARVALPAYTDGVWHGLLPGAAAGLVYGLRAHGPQDAARGHRFNPHKLLLDPYARRLTTHWRWSEAHLGDVHDKADRHVTLDNARDMPKAVVEHEHFDWQDDRAPRTPLADTLLYEVHVKGFTWRHAEVPAEQRGRFLGVSSAPAILHLRRLGVTAVTLLPVQQHLTEAGLARRGAHNYWGYNTVAFNVPDARFAATDAVREFKTMVRGRHRQQPRPVTTARLAVRARLAALLGDGHARRRLPLRPRDLAGARRAGLRCASSVPDGDRPGPHPVARETHCRAVGCRPGRLPARAFSGRLVGVERSLPRRGARILGAQDRRPRRVRRASGRLQRAVPPRRPRRVCRHQLPHCP